MMACRLIAGLSAGLLLFAASDRSAAIEAWLVPTSWVEDETPISDVPDAVLRLDGSWPLLDEAGAMVFEAPLEQPGPTYTSAIWRIGPNDDLDLVARAGSAEFDGIGLAGLNGAGQVVLGGTPSGDPNHTLFGPGPGGPLDVLAQEEGPAPGLEPGSTFYLLASPYVADTGAIVFDTLANIGGVVSTGHHGIWKSDPAVGLELVLFTGDPAPGIAGRTLTSIGKPVVDAEGGISVEATLSPSGSDDSVVLSSDGSGPFSVVAADGGPAPGIPGATLCGLPPLARADDGTVAIHAFLCDVSFEANRALYLLEGTTLDLVAREGDAAPGVAPVGFYEFHDAAAGAGGALAFEARLNPPLFEHFGIWFHLPGAALQLVVLAGDPIADRPGLVLEDINLLSMNDDDRILVSGELGAAGRALLTFAPDDGLRTLVAPGDTIMLGPGDVRTVSNVHVAPDRRPGRRMLNDANQLAVWVEFEEGSHAVMTAALPVPEPGHTPLLGVGSLVLALAAGRQRARRYA